MSIGFKKSLFGFNCSDVIDYIDRTHKTFISKEKKLNEKVDSLLQDLELAKEKEEKLILEKQELSAKLDEFNAKYDEIERLSENIGKLYLVAQTNAKTIMASSQKNAEMVSIEVERNITSIDEAHKSLNELRKSISKTTEDFVNEVDTLLGSLNVTREQIAENTEKAISAEEEFNEVFETIVR